MDSIQSDLSVGIDAFGFFVAASSWCKPPAKANAWGFL